MKWFRVEEGLAIPLNFPHLAKTSMHGINFLESHIKWNLGSDTL